MTAIEAAAPATGPVAGEQPTGGQMRQQLERALDQKRHLSDRAAEEQARARCWQAAAMAVGVTLPPALIAEAARVLRALDESVTTLETAGVDRRDAASVLGDPADQAGRALALTLARWRRTGRLPGSSPAAVVPLRSIGAVSG